MLVIKRSMNEGFITYRKCCHFKRGNEEIHLTKGESVVIFELLSHLGEIVPRETLFTALWGNDGNFETRTLDMHIKQLRKKLGKDADLIETSYGAGYRFKNE